MYTYENNESLASQMDREANECIKQRRKEFDSYQTPLYLAEKMCRYTTKLTALWTPGVVVDPTAGAGNVVRAARAAWPEIPLIAVDIQETNKTVLTEAGANLVQIGAWQDFATAIQWDDDTLIIGNPPYAVAQSIIETSMQNMLTGDWLVFLLRMGFLASKTRNATLWRQKGLRYLIPIAKRPTFTNNGRTENSEYGIYMWKKGYTGRAELVFEHELAEEVSNVAPHTKLDAPDMVMGDGNGMCPTACRAQCPGGC